MAVDPNGTRAIQPLLRLVVGLLLTSGLYHYSAGSGTARDPMVALRTVAVRYPSIKTDLDLARLGPACDAGEMDACTELGVNYRGVRDSLGEAGLPACVDRALFDRACGAGNWQGCAELARRTRVAECGPADLEHARDVLHEACRRLVFPACDALGTL